MIIRIFEYGSQIALQSGVIENDTLHVTFPQAAILYLRSNKNTPDALHIHIHTAGGDVRYAVPVIKMQSYTLEELFEKELYFLLPFYLFLHEKELQECNDDEAKLETLKGKFIWMREQLDKLTLKGKIDEYTEHMILNMTEKVVSNLAHKQERVEKEVNSIMRGPIIMTEATRIYMKGEEAGLKLGEERGLRLGEERGINNTIRLVMDMGANMEDAIRMVAKQYNIQESKVKQIWEQQ